MTNYSFMESGKYLLEQSFVNAVVVPKEGIAARQASIT